MSLDTRQPLPENTLIDFGKKKYRITSKLRSGGFAITYLAVQEDSTAKGQVVLKELYPKNILNAVVKRNSEGKVCATAALSGNQEQVEQYWMRQIESMNREAHVTEELGVLFHPGSQHPFRNPDHLIAEGCRQDKRGNYYLIYETYSGIPLSRIIESGWPDNWKQNRNGNLLVILTLLGDLAAKLYFLHEKGILHLDISPDNIFVSESVRGTRPVPFLIDFGSAVKLTNGQPEAGHHYTVNLQYSSPSLFPNRLRITPTYSMDTYSIAAILYYAATGLSPGKHQFEMWQDTLSDYFPKEIYGTLADEFIRFFRCGLSATEGEGFRTADELYAAIKTLEFRLRTFSGLLSCMPDRIRAAHYTFNRFPLFNYLSENREARVLCVGCGETADAFIRTAFWCGQMTDSGLSITVLSPDAEEYREKLLRDCPALTRFTNLGQAGAEEHYADFAFDCRRLSPQETAEAYPDCRYIIVDVGNSSENRQFSERLNAAKGQHSDIIHYAHTEAIVRDSPLNLSMQHLFSNVEPIHPIGCGGDARENAFNLTLERTALNVHLAYAGVGYDPGRRKEETGKFLSSGYSQESSAAAALHIPYKLNGIAYKLKQSGINLDKLCEYDKTGRLLQELKEEKTQNDMIYLEHRRWVAYMVMKGFSVPQEQDIRRYAFQGENKFHSEKEKLHPCLVPCGRDGIILTQESFDTWKDADKEPSDPLDRVSLRLHRIAADLTEQNKALAEAYLSIICAKLTEKEPKTRKELERITEQLERDCRSLYQEGGEMPAWQKYEKAFADLGSNAEIELAALKNYLRPAEEYRKYVDYKKFDRSIVDLIPRLLLT